jgi:lipopolysaccharide export system permease protein
MIFERSVQRELGTIAGGVFTAVVALWITVVLVRTLGDAAGGRVGNEAVLTLIALSTLNVLPTVLVVTLFVSVLMTLTRAYRDSEMVVWFSAGLSLTAWIKPVLRFALPLVGAIAVLSLVVTPWANRQITDYRERFAKRSDIAKVAAGQFRESGSADRVFFVEGLTSDLSKVQNVFVRWVQSNSWSVIAAKTGRMEDMPNGDRFLILEKGRRYDTVPGEREFKVTSFERYGVKVAERNEVEVSEQSTKATPTRQLLRDFGNLRNRGEILWRVGLPLAALNFALLAIPLAFANPRRGRSASLMIALLGFFTYLNAISLVQANVVQGRIGFWPGWWLPHAVVFGVVVVLFWHRLSITGWRRRSAKAGA